jgi:hypothetical protein
MIIRFFKNAVVETIGFERFKENQWSPGAAPQPIPDGLLNASM